MGRDRLRSGRDRIQLSIASKSKYPKIQKIGENQNGAPENRNQNENERKAYFRFTEGARVIISSPKGGELTPDTNPNDDVNVEHYQGTSRTFVGRQRRGIMDDHPNARSMDEHIEEALGAPFFLNQSTPIPKACERALEFIDNADSDAIREFWKRQNQRVRALTESLATDHRRWKEQIPEELRASSGKLHAPAFF